MLTVAEAWDLNLPPETRLVGGQAGLGREVAWAAATRPLAPVFPRFRGGELALASLTALSRLSPPVTAVQLVSRLAQAGVAALALVGNPSAEAARLADDHSLPLFVLPDDASLNELEHRIARCLLERRAAIQQIAQNVDRELLELALRGHGIAVVVQRFKELANRSVLYESATLDLVEYQPQGVAPDRKTLARLLAGNRQAVASWLDGQSLSPSAPPVRHFSLDSKWSRIVAPVVRDAEPAGYISLLADGVRLGELERQMLSRASAACAVEVSRVPVVETVDVPAGGLGAPASDLKVILDLLGQRPEALEFRQELLGPLIEYDQKHKSDLVRTLDAFLVSGGSPTAAAERLGLHRNTLLYRLRRIAEVSKLDLEDAEVQLSLYLALRLGEEG
ncbi:MAG: helix-turn-helix domain-containing protein [Chloroflexi bacterium]|nr:helix-turn-helix domain-containing protein [Chloroflexota bacterium]